MKMFLKCYRAGPIYHTWEVLVYFAWYRGWEWFLCWRQIPVFFLPVWAVWSGRRKRSLTVSTSELADHLEEKTFLLEWKLHLYTHSGCCSPPPSLKREGKIIWARETGLSSKPTHPPRFCLTFHVLTPAGSECWESGALGELPVLLGVSAEGWCKTLGRL